MFQTKVVEKIKSSNSLLFSHANRAVFEMCKNVVVPGRPHTTIRRMRIACCVPKASNTRSEYVTLCFPLQPCLHERTSVLRFTYIVCFVSIFCVVLRSRACIRFEIGGTLEGRDRPLLSGLLISLFALSVKRESCQCARHK